MKKCSKCEIEKDESEFSKRKSSIDGLYWNCKKCTKEDKKRAAGAAENAMKTKILNYGLTLLEGKDE